MCNIRQFITTRQLCNNLYKAIKTRSKLYSTASTSITRLDFEKPTYAVITGASKGLGQIISVHLASRLECPSKFVLIANDDQGLEDTKNLILTENPEHKVDVVNLDLSEPNPEDYKCILDDTLDKKYENSVIFHNAGSIGRAARTAELTNLDDWTKFYNLVLFSAALLNTAFLQKLKDNSKCHVVNITSYSGKKPTLGLGFYCSGKAARNIYFGCVSVEEPKVSVLSFSPGTVRTDIFKTIDEASEEIRNVFKNVKYVDRDLTIDWLMNVLEHGNYASGEVVDYWNRK